MSWSYGWGLKVGVWILIRFSVGSASRGQDYRIRDYGWGLEVGLGHRSPEWELDVSVNVLNRWCFSPLSSLEVIPIGLLHWPAYNPQLWQTSQKTLRKKTGETLWDQLTEGPSRLCCSMWWMERKTVEDRLQIYCGFQSSGSQQHVDFCCIDF